MGANIQRYRIQWKSGAQDFSDAREMTVAGTETDATVPDLRNGTEYTIRVRAEAIVGNGAWSDAVTATPVAAPDQVTGLMFGAGTGTELMPVWLEPDDNGIRNPALPAPMEVREPEFQRSSLANDRQHSMR